MPEAYLTEIVQTKIYSIRGHQVMLDSDIAEIYAVETKRINEAVNNNPEKFPDDFYFELIPDEQAFLRSKFSTLKKGRGQHRKYAPKAFTEKGLYMLATTCPVKCAVPRRGFNRGSEKPTGCSDHHCHH